MNSISLIGRVGRDVEMRHVSTGKKVGSTSLALYKSKDETLWVKVEAWEKTAELLQQFAKKGQLVGITGRLDIQKWKDNNGNERETPVVIATNVSPCGAKQEGSSGSGGGNGFSGSDIELAKKKAAKQAKQASAAGFSDDVPF